MPVIAEGIAAKVTKVTWPIVLKCLNTRGCADNGQLICVWKVQLSRASEQVGLVPIVSMTHPADASESAAAIMDVTKGTFLRIRFFPDLVFCSFFFFRIISFEIPEKNIKFIERSENLNIICIFLERESLQRSIALLT